MSGIIIGMMKKDIWRKGQAVLCIGLTILSLLTGCNNAGLTLSPSEQQETTSTQKENSYSKKFRDLTDEVFPKTLRFMFILLSVGVLGVDGVF